jgi:hypothetical protein
MTCCANLSVVAIGYYGDAFRDHYSSVLIFILIHFEEIALQTFNKWIKKI